MYSTYAQREKNGMNYEHYLDANAFWVENWIWEEMVSFSLSVSFLFDLS